MLHRNAVCNSLENNVQPPDNIVNNHKKTEDLKQFEDRR